MAVYLIRAGLSGSVKIGFSKNVLSRLGKMQSDNYEKLQIIRILVGGKAEENKLHVLFYQNRLHGEWFSFHPLMLGDLGIPDVPLLTRKICTIRRMAYDEPLQKALKAVGGPSKLADALKIGASAVTQWTRIPPRHLPKVSQLTGIPMECLRPDLWPAPVNT